MWYVVGVVAALALLGFALRLKLRKPEPVPYQAPLPAPGVWTAPESLTDQSNMSPKEIEVWHRVVDMAGQGPYTVERLCLFIWDESEGLLSSEAMTAMAVTVMHVSGFPLTKSTLRQLEDAFTNLERAKDQYGFVPSG